MPQQYINYLSPSDRDWLAGLLDAEAYFGGSGRGMRSCTIQLAMTDRDTVERAAALLGAAVYERRYPLPRQHQWRTSLYGKPAAQTLVQLYPLLSQRRQSKVAPFLPNMSGLELPDSYEWLAGILEGEGSFFMRQDAYPHPVCVVAMTDEDVIVRAAVLMGGTYLLVTRPFRKPIYRCSIGSGRAANLMQRIYPLMSTRRQGQIAAAIAGFEAGRAMGERHVKTTLTNGQVREIYRRAHGGERTSDLAAEFGIAPSVVSAIKTGRTWGHVTGLIDLEQ